MNTSSDPATAKYDELFNVVVAGSLPTATEAQEEASWKVLETLAQFDETENRAFVKYLQSRLSDPSPFVRMESAFNIALIRDELGISEQNKDLIPIFEILLQHEDVMVKKYALNDMDPVVHSNLKEELRPLVKPLMSTMGDSFMTYQSITLLGDMGPVAKEAVPLIRSAAEREKDEIIDKAASEAIQKIEMGERQ